MSRHAPSPALAKGSLILVTGASSFIGSHVVNEALKAGYRVRGTTRTEEKAETTKKIFNHPDYTTAIVADFRHEGSFDDAIKDCEAVIHVASDMSFGSDPNEVVTPTVDGVLSILRSASRTASVRRFVLTSSSAAALFPQSERAFTATADTWNDMAVKIAWAPPPYAADRAFPVYAASKVEAERALWKFMRDERPGFVANAILPNYNMGRILPNGSAGATGRGVIDVFHGEIPQMPPQYMIDVVDDARLHVIAAALDPSLRDGRIFAFNVAFNWTDVIRVIRDAYPHASAVATPPQDEPRDLSKVPNALGAELLARWYGQVAGYKPFEQSVRENLEGVA